MRRYRDWRSGHRCLIAPLTRGEKFRYIVCRARLHTHAAACADCSWRSLSVGTKQLRWSETAATNLLRRTRFGVRFHFASLHVDEMTQLALHRFKSVVDDFGNWFVRAVVLLFFVRDELVAA